MNCINAYPHGVWKFTHQPIIGANMIAMVNMTLHQNLLVMSFNSLSFSASAFNDGIANSSTIPQIGQDPGTSDATSGSMGQMYFAFCIVEDCCSRFVTSMAGFAGAIAPMLTTLSDAIAIACWLWPFSSQCFGLLLNFVAQPTEQKKYSVPSKDSRPRALAGSTVMPHTRSRAIEKEYSCGISAGVGCSLLHQWCEAKLKTHVRPSGYRAHRAPVPGG